MRNKSKLYSCKCGKRNNLWNGEGPENPKNIGVPDSKRNDYQDTKETTEYVKVAASVESRWCHQ